MSELVEYMNNLKNRVDSIGLEVPEADRVREYILNEIAHFFDKELDGRQIKYITAEQAERLKDDIENETQRLEADELAWVRRVQAKKTEETNEIIKQFNECIQILNSVKHFNIREVHIENSVLYRNHIFKDRKFLQYDAYERDINGFILCNGRGRPILNGESGKRVDASAYQEKVCSTLAGNVKELLDDVDAAYKNDLLELKADMQTRIDEINRLNSVDDSTKNTLISEDFFGEGVDVDISRIFPVVVMATMSSGKSTFINALLGEEVLPNRNEACTAKIFSVLDDDTATENKLYVTRKNGDVEVITEELAKELELANDDDSVSEILLSGQIKGVQNTERSMLLIDTPGPNNSRDLSHAQITEQILNKINGGMILYVMNATQMGTDDDCELLRMVSDKLKNKENLKILFVMNKMDELDVEKESVFDFIRDIEEYLGKNGFANPEIIPVSALAAILFKKAAKGKKLTRKQQNDFERMYETFKSEGIRFGMHAAQAELQNEVEVCGMKYTVGQLERAIENTGLMDLEQKIQEYQILSSGTQALKVNVRDRNNDVGRSYWNMWKFWEKSDIFKK